jgi:hypothetical protein
MLDGARHKMPLKRTLLDSLTIIAPFLAATSSIICDGALTWL